MKKDFGDRSSMWDLRVNSTSARGADMEGARVLQRYLAKHLCKKPFESVKTGGVPRIQPPASLMPRLL
jgi:hypothetical protein